jgi:hypothetical protein
MRLLRVVIITHEVRATQKQSHAGAEMMAGMTTGTKFYILSVIFTGASLLIWSVMGLSHFPLSILILTGLTSIAQVLKVEGPTERSSYNVSWVFYGFTYLLYGTPATLFVIVVAHLVEWIRHKYPWYIQTFNIAVYCIAISLAGFVNSLINPKLAITDLSGAIGFVIAIIVFTFVNHLLVGWVIRLARGQSIKESGVFESITLLIDITMFGLGIASAVIWIANPLLAILNLIPLYLLYKALRVPALMRRIEELQTSGVNSD